MSATFAENTLVLMHLPDYTRNGAIVPVAGVIVTPSDEQSVIRIRDLAGNTREIVVNNKLLSER